MKALIEQLYDLVKESAGEVKQVDVWNEQLDSLPTEHPFNAPAVFIDLNNLGVQAETAIKALSGNLELHYVYEDYQESADFTNRKALEAFDLAASLACKLDGQEVCGENALFKACGMTLSWSGWRREYRGNLTDYILTFSTSFNLCPKE